MYFPVGVNEVLTVERHSTVNPLVHYRTQFVCVCVLKTNES